MASVQVYPLLLLMFIGGGLAIQCYQCDSNEDETCPSGHKFDTTVNAMLNCNGFEADIPGQFCVKITRRVQDGEAGRRQLADVAQGQLLVLPGAAGGRGITQGCSLRLATVRIEMAVTVQAGCLAA